MTSSIRYFEVAGSTRPARRLTSISARPSARRLRCVQMSAARFFPGAGRLSFFFPGAVAAGVRSDRPAAYRRDACRPTLALTPIGEIWQNRQGLPTRRE